MAEKKGWGSTVLGWFVVPDEAAQASEAARPAPATSGSDATDDIIRRYAGGGAGKSAPRPGGGAKAKKPDTAPPRSPSGEAPPDFGSGGGSGAAAPATAKGSDGGFVPAPGNDGAVDFAAVYRKAGISDEEADRVKRALTLLEQLPAETPQPVKKQIVEASLNSFGVPIESIIESAVAEIEALHGCIEAGQNATKSLLEESEQRIAALERQIADVRQVMDARATEQRALTEQARTQGLKVQQILEFFGQELVGKVVKDSPRLHEPKV